MMHAESTVQPNQARHFALCESCYWSATLIAEILISCPFCPESSVSLIPLAADEHYRLKLSPTSGLEFVFSRFQRAS